MADGSGADAGRLATTARNALASMPFMSLVEYGASMDVVPIPVFETGQEWDARFEEALQGREDEVVGDTELVALLEQLRGISTDSLQLLPDPLPSVSKKPFVTPFVSSLESLLASCTNDASAGGRRPAIPSGPSSIATASASRASSAATAAPRPAKQAREGGADEPKAKRRVAQALPAPHAKEFEECMDSLVEEHDASTTAMVSTGAPLTTQYLHEGRLTEASVDTLLLRFVAVSHQAGSLAELSSSSLKHLVRVLGEQLRLGLDSGVEEGAPATFPPPASEPSEADVEEHKATLARAQEVTRLIRIAHVMALIMRSAQIERVMEDDVDSIVRIIRTAGRRWLAPYLARLAIDKNKAMIPNSAFFESELAGRIGQTIQAMTSLMLLGRFAERFVVSATSVAAQFCFQSVCRVLQVAACEMLCTAFRIMPSQRDAIFVETLGAWTPGIESVKSLDAPASICVVLMLNMIQSIAVASSDSLTPDRNAPMDEVLHHATTIVKCVMDTLLPNGSEALVLAIVGDLLTLMDMPEFPAAEIILHVLSGTFLADATLPLSLEVLGLVLAGLYRQPETRGCLASTPVDFDLTTVATWRLVRTLLQGPASHHLAARFRVFQLAFDASRVSFKVNPPSFDILHRVLSEDTAGSLPPDEVSPPPPTSHSLLMLRQFRALAQNADTLVECLLRASGDKTPSVRQRAMVALGRAVSAWPQLLDDPRVQSCVEARMVDVKTAVRHRAVAVVAGYLHTTNAVQHALFRPFKQRLRDVTVSVSKAVIDVLASLVSAKRLALSDISLDMLTVAAGGEESAQEQAQKVLVDLFLGTAANDREDSRVSFAQLPADARLYIAQVLEALDAALVEAPAAAPALLLHFFQRACVPPPRKGQAPGALASRAAQNTVGVTRLAAACLDRAIHFAAPVAAGDGAQLQASPELLRAIEVLHVLGTAHPPAMAPHLSALVSLSENPRQLSSDAVCQLAELLRRVLQDVDAPDDHLLETLVLRLHQLVDRPQRVLEAVIPTMCTAINLRRSSAVRKALSQGKNDQPLRAVGHWLATVVSAASAANTPVEASIKLGRLFFLAALVARFLSNEKQSILTNGTKPVAILLAAFNVLDRLSTGPRDGVLQSTALQQLSKTSLTALGYIIARQPSLIDKTKAYTSALRADSSTELQKTAVVGLTRLLEHARSLQEARQLATPNKVSMDEVGDANALRGPVKAPGGSAEEDDAVLGARVANYFADVQPLLLSSDAALRERALVLVGKLKAERHVFPGKAFAELVALSTDSARTSVSRHAAELVIQHGGSSPAEAALVAFHFNVSVLGNPLPCGHRLVSPQSFEVRSQLAALLPPKKGQARAAVVRDLAALFGSVHRLSASFIGTRAAQVRSRVLPRAPLTDSVALPTCALVTFLAEAVAPLPLRPDECTLLIDSISRALSSASPPSYDSTEGLDDALTLVALARLKASLHVRAARAGAVECLLDVQAVRALQSVWMQQRELATVAEGARALYVEHVEGGDMEPVSVRRGGAGKPRKRTGSGQGAARKKGRSKRGDYFDDDEDEDEDDEALDNSDEEEAVAEDDYETDDDFEDSPPTRTMPARSTRGVRRAYREEDSDDDLEVDELGGEVKTPPKKAPRKAPAGKKQQPKAIAVIDDVDF